MDWRCGNCGSDDMRSAKLVYELGSSSVRLNGSHAGGMSGVAFGPGGLSVGTAGGGGAVELSGESISGLAQRCAPPRQKEVSRNFGCLVLFVVPTVAIVWPLFHIGSPLAWFAAGIAALLLLGWIGMWRDASRAKRWNAEVWPVLHREWAAQWVCMRCGTINNPPAAE